MASICDGPLTSLAFCWTIERSDGAGLALTSGDRQVRCGGTAYQPEPGVTPAAITRSLGLEPHSAEVSGALSARALTDSDLLLGRWDAARISMSAVDWESPDEQPVQLLGGELGEVSLSGDSFTAQLNGAAAKLSGPVCPSTSAECRAELGDKKCRVDLAGRTVRTRVTSAEDNLIVTDQPLDQRYQFGRLRYLSGANCGLQTVILAANGTQITVRDRARAAVEAGTVVEIREGCDKLFATCVSRFSNAINFRGEPHVPGNDLLTRYP
jgi:uncharacterized phage protein (TIGR02218 family)